ncbi:MAG: hypothetical protein SGPRY_003996 [Prymnesium sp.]
METKKIAGPYLLTTRLTVPVTAPLNTPLTTPFTTAPSAPLSTPLYTPFTALLTTLFTELVTTTPLQSSSIPLTTRHRSLHTSLHLTTPLTTPLLPLHTSLNTHLFNCPPHLSPLATALHTPYYTSYHSFLPPHTSRHLVFPSHHLLSATSPHPLPAHLCPAPIGFRQLECSRWCPDVKVLMEQADGGLDGQGLAFNILLTTYEARPLKPGLVMKDKQRLRRFRYRYIIIDEGHRMKNATSKLSATLMQYEAEHRVLLTAAAGGDRCAEDLAMSEEESLLVINRLHQVLRPFLLRRMKTEVSTHLPKPSCSPNRWRAACFALLSQVEAQLPDKAEYVVKCELSGMQKLMYRQIQDQGLCTVGAGGELKVSGLNNVEMQLRKVCNHPYLFFTPEQREEVGSTPCDPPRTSSSPPAPPFC